MNGVHKTLEKKYRRKVNVSRFGTYRLTSGGWKYYTTHIEFKPWQGGKWIEVGDLDREEITQLIAALDQSELETL